MMADSEAFHPNMWRKRRRMIVADVLFSETGHGMQQISG